ncbi:MAG: polysaccharide pyruvyl transferase family protein [Anaerocolumna sp.]
MAVPQAGLRYAMGIKMKVGIITFHKVNNYGAVLQAYALQTTLQKLDCDCDIIDYNRKNFRDIVLWQKNKIKCFIKGKPDHQGYSNMEFINMVLTTVFFNKKAVSGKFESFRGRYQLSRSVNSDTVKSLNKEYDLFISGSDQVFNCGRVILDKNYLLDFVETGEKKGSYAASFGIKEIPDKYLKDYKELLSDFTYLSVREETGADLIETLIGREAKVVLDPTLLLKKEEWAGLIGKKLKKEDVIIVYMLEYSESLLRYARELSMRTNIPLRILNKPFHHKLEEECRADVGPMEWLLEIQHAKYVVTNSFHGVAFSINFNRNFYVEIAEERIRGAMASRIEHILKMFGLEDRLIRKAKSGNSKDKAVNLKYSSTDIDYNKVNGKLEELRIDSIEYLRKMLKADEGEQDLQIAAARSI